MTQQTNQNISEDINSQNNQRNFSISTNDILQPLVENYHNYRRTHTSAGTLITPPVNTDFLVSTDPFHRRSSSATVLMTPFPRTLRPIQIPEIEDSTEDFYAFDSLLQQESPSFLVSINGYVINYFQNDLTLMAIRGEDINTSKYLILHYSEDKNGIFVGTYISVKEMLSLMIQNKKEITPPILRIRGGGEPKITQRVIKRTTFDKVLRVPNSFSQLTVDIRKSQKDKTIQLERKRSIKKRNLQHAIHGGCEDEEIFQFEAQMNPFNMGLDVKIDDEVADSLNTLSSTFAKGIKVNHTIDKDFTSTIESLGKLLSSKGVKLETSLGLNTENFDSKQILFAIILAATLLHHYNKQDTTSLGIVIAVVGTGMLTQSSITMPGFVEIGSQLVKYVNEFNSVKPQMNSDSLSQLVTAGVMFLAASATGQSNKPWYTEIVNQALNYKKNHDSLSSCITGVIKLVETIISYVTRDILGGNTFVFLESNRSDINEFLSKVTRLSDGIHNNTFAFTPQNADLIHELWLESKEMILKLPRGSDSNILVALNNATQYLYSQKKIFDGMNLSMNGSRIEPVSVLFLGPPGTGKSNLLYPLSYKILQKTLPEDKFSQFKSDPNSFIFNRQAETVYWDGYNMDKYICFIDDLGQMKDVAGNPDNEWMNWIRMCSNFNYVLHMAALEKKGNVYFRSRFVFANSNLKQFNVESIMEIEAFKRRVDKCYICVPRIEFCKEGTDKGNLWSRRLDGRKLPMGPLGITELTPDTSDFFEFDTMTEQETGNVLTYDQVAAEILKLADLKEKRHQQTNLYLNSIVEQTYVTPQGYVPKTEKIFDNQKDIDAFNLVLRDNPDKNEIRCYLMGCFNKLLGYEAPLEVVLSYFIKTKGERFMKCANGTVLDFYDFIDEIEEMEVDDSTFEDVPKLQKTRVFGKLLEVFSSAYTNIKDLLLKSGNFLVVQGSAILDYVKSKSEMFLILFGALTALGVTSYIFSSFWNKVTPFFSESYSGKPQRDRSGKKARKPISSKDLRKHATAAPIVASSIQSGGKYDESNMSIVTKIIKRNCYELWLPDQDSRLGFVTFIKGRTFMMPKHFADEMHDIIEEHPHYAERLVTFKKSGSAVVVQCKMTDMLNIVSQTELDCLDAVFVQAPEWFNVHADITKYFMKKSELLNYKLLDFRLVLPKVEGFESWMGKAYPITNELITSSCSYVLSRGFKYHAMTKVGDCGALFTILDNYSGSSKILGIHVAGSPSSGVGISTSISFEDVDANMAKNEIQYDFENDLFPQKAETILDGQFVEKYHHEYNVSSASLTKIKRSPLYESWGPAKTSPAKLRPFKTEDGVEVDPYLVALKKYSVPFKYIDPVTISKVGDCVFDHLNAVSIIPVEKRIFTFEEAVTGLDKEPDFAPISRATSMGFPDNSVPGKKPKGKTGVWGNDEYYTLDSIASKELESDCAKIVECGMQAIRLEHIYVDCKKDERRAHEKVAKGATRLFSSCPIRLLIVFRQYFGAFMLWCQKNKIENGFAVGANPYSVDWHLIAQKLLQFGDRKTKNIGAGDFSGFDCKEKPIIHWDILKHINEWYNDGNDTLRRVLWLEIVNSNHIYGNVVYAWLGSNPSGNPMTTLINNLYNHYVAVYVWYKQVGFDDQLLFSFYEKVYYITLGDDNTFSVSLDSVHLFNEKAMEENASDLGMVYTSETKGAVSSVMRDITQVSFLKRQFRYEQAYDRYCAPLELSVILEIPYWTKSCSQEDQIVRDNLDCSIRELALHPRETFDRYIDIMVSNSQNKIGYTPSMIRRYALLRALEGRVDWY